MRIAVVGSGYVGLVAGACFADLGHDVILVDNDQSKLAALRNGQVPIHEKFLPELAKLEDKTKVSPRNLFSMITVESICIVAEQRLTELGRA